MDVRRFFCALVVLLSLGLLYVACSPTTSSPPMENPVTVAATTSANPEGATSGLATFEEELKQAFAQKDFPALESAMADEFVIAFWQGNTLPPLPPADAMGQMRALHLPPEPPRFVEPDAPYRELLGGLDPLTMWGADAHVVAVLFSQGWGRDGAGEAILALAQRPDGSYAWYGLLLAPTGFLRTM